ncbi:MAG: hypothetical protein IJT95_01700 [Abditibacteriota bacterium]|nr:hypothetical protein [Abditibacteriota bacterium]
MAEEYYYEHGGRKEGPLCKADLVRWRRLNIIGDGDTVTDADGKAVGIGKLLGSAKSQGNTLGAWQRSFHFYRKAAAGEKKWPTVVATLVLIIVVLTGFGFSVAGDDPVDLSSMTFAQIEDHYKNSRSSYSVETKGKNETEKFVYLTDKGRRTFVVFNGYTGLMTLDFKEPCSEEEALAALDVPAEGEPVRKVAPGGTEKKDIIEFPAYNPRVEFVRLYAKDGKVSGSLVKFKVNREE